MHTNSPTTQKPAHNPTTRQQTAHMKLNKWKLGTSVRLILENMVIQQTGGPNKSMGKPLFAKNCSDNCMKVISRQTIG
jgi:hypothetical protein